MLTLLLASALALAGPTEPLPVATFKARLVYTDARKEPLQDGVVVIRGDRIVAVGPAAEIALPESGLVFEGAVLTAGFIDLWTTAGLTGPFNESFDQDHAEGGDPVQPELRALDAFNPHDPLVGWVSQFGVTTMLVAPSPGQPVGGQPVVVAPIPRTQAVVDTEARDFMVFSLGDAAKERFGNEGAGSRMGNAAIIRQALMDAREYRERRQLRGADRAPRDLGMDALVEVLEHKRTPIFHANRASDLATVARIIEEFELDQGEVAPVIAGASEGWLATDILGDLDPSAVAVGPVMSRSWRPGEQRNSNFEGASLLHEAGLQPAFMSGYEGYVPKVRVILWEAAISVANGLGSAEGLAALTTTPATVLGIADQTGTLEVGKRADLVLFDGDPFEVTSHACAVVARGVLVSEECH